MKDDFLNIIDNIYIQIKNKKNSIPKLKDIAAFQDVHGIIQIKAFVFNDFINDYDDVISHSLQAINSLKTEILNLKEQIQNLQNENNKLKSNTIYQTQQYYNASNALNSSKKIYNNQDLESYINLIKSQYFYDKDSSSNNIVPIQNTNSNNINNKYIQQNEVIANKNNNNIQNDSNLNNLSFLNNDKCNDNINDCNLDNNIISNYKRNQINTIIQHKKAYTTNSKNKIYEYNNNNEIDNKINNNQSNDIYLNNNNIYEDINKSNKDISYTTKKNNKEYSQRLNITVLENEYQTTKEKEIFEKILESKLIKEYFAQKFGEGKFNIFIEKYKKKKINMNQIENDFNVLMTVINKNKPIMKKKLRKSTSLKEYKDVYKNPIKFENILRTDNKYNNTKKKMNFNIHKNNI